MASQMFSYSLKRPGEDCWFLETEKNILRKHEIPSLHMWKERARPLKMTVELLGFEPSLCRTLLLALSLIMKVLGVPKHKQETQIFYT